MNKKEQGGSITLFVCLVLLPILFFLFSLSLDMTTYYRQSSEIQKILDEGALLGYKALPFQDKAEETARSYLSQFGEFLQDTRIEAGTDFLSLSLESTLPLPFARYFLQNAGLPIYSSVKARGTPYDILLLLDASAYLAPISENEELWGDELEWPDAEFFRFDHLFYKLDENGDTNVVSPRFVTQLCFNPAFSILKSAFISAYEYFSGFHYNAVGASVFPGSFGRFLDEIRPLFMGGSAIPQGGEAIFDGYIRPYYGGDQYCASAGYRENQHLPYRFPSRNSHIEGLWNPGPGAPSLVLPPDWEFNPEYRDYLRLSEVIWSKVVHPETPFTNIVLDEAIAKLMSFSLEDRGGLKNNVVKYVLIFAGDVPWGGSQRFLNAEDEVAESISVVFQNLRNIISQQPELVFRLNYIILQHEHSPPDLDTRFQNLSEYFATQEIINEAPVERFSLKAIKIQNMDQFSSVLGDLIRGARVSLLSE